MIRRCLFAAVIAAATLVALLSSAAEAGKGKKSSAASVVFRTASQTQALQTNRLLVAVKAPRATRARISATVRRTVKTRRGKRAVRSVSIARTTTVRLRRGKARIAVLRLNRAGRRLLAGCTTTRVTVGVRGLRRSGVVRRSRALVLDRCRRPGAPATGRTGATPRGPIPGCAAADAPGGEWRFYSGVLDGNREQRAKTSIDTANVADLGVAWKTETPDGGVIHSTPVVADGCVFFGTDLGNAFAVNADTGKLVWKQALGAGAQGSGTFEGAGIVGAPAVVDGLVYVPTTTPKASVLSALDQASGKVVWQRVVDADEGGGLDSSPVPFNGMIFQAFKGDESSDHSKPGFVIVDASREGGGAILVKTYTIPEEDFKKGYRGGSIINTPTVDLKRKQVFAGTGNPASEKQHPRTNSLLKIDADPVSPTFGKILASHRGTSDSYPAPQDIDSPTCRSDLQWPIGRYSCAQFDFNFLASPNLWTNAQGRPMFGGLQKSGVYTAIYADTMERAWQATVGPPCFGCNLSSTAVDKSGIFVAVTGGNLYSLNRDTGRPQWTTPLTGSFRYNGLAVANGIVYSLNDAVGTLQAFNAASGAPLFAHPFMQDSGSPMHDQGNSSGVSVARNTVFATSQWEGTSTLFALKVGATGDGGDEPSQDPPPGGGGGGGAPSASPMVVTGPGATNVGYLTPSVVMNKGQSLSYTNADAVRHNVVSPEGKFRSELADAGQTVPVAGAEKLEPGTYNFICQPHPGMKGQLIVR
jgi:outer membrane protein assembly factor BamB/plastocyanin